MNGMLATIDIEDLDYLATGQRPGKDYISWDVSNVTDMGGMFSGAGISNLQGIANWDVHNVLDMSYMFAYDYGVDDDAILPLNNWTVNPSLYMADMFYDAGYITVYPIWYSE